MLDSKILDRALKTIEKVYNESMYGRDDLYRIKDIIHSVDENHWKSKQWLAEKINEIYEYPNGHSHAYIVGGWYGMMAYQLRKLWSSPEMNITSGDMDPEAKIIGRMIYHGYNLQFETIDIKNKMNFYEYSIIINTSCEHMEQKDLLDIIKKKKSKTWVCFQTNDYDQLNSHINCFKSAEEFADSLPINKAYVGTLNLNDFNRFMVIGR